MVCFWKIVASEIEKKCEKRRISRENVVYSQRETKIYEDL